MKAPVTYSARQIVGRRARQEDAYKIIDHGDMLIAAVADGLGGHPGGDIASLTAVEGLNAFVEENLEALAERPVEALIHGVQAIDAGLRELAHRHPQLDGMATTLSLLYITPTRVFRLSVGDSLIYRCVRGRCWRWNQLHENEAGYLTSCLGSSFGDIDCPGRGTLLKSGDRYLIASDGVEILGEMQIAETLARARTPKQAVDQMIAGIKAAAYPYQDNVTLIALFAD